MNAQTPPSIMVLLPTLPPADAVLPYLRRIDDTGMYSNNGPLYREFCAGFSRFLADRTSAKGEVDAAVVTNGTVAIELALRHVAKPDRRHVIIPSYTFVATAHAVANVGKIPFLADCDEETLTLTPETAKAAMEALGEDPAAVVVVSPFGGPIDVPLWERFEAETGVPVVFDAAAAATSLTHIGSQPVCLSLHATKVFGIGEAGVIVSRDPALVHRMRGMAGFGFDGAARSSVYRGGNYKVSEYTCAVGLAVLADMERKIAALFELTRAYQTGLGEAARLQPGCGTDWVSLTTNVILPDDRVADVLGRFDARGIMWRRWWGDGVHTHPAFADCPRADLTVTEKVAYRTIGVPLHEKLSSHQIAQVCQAIHG
jgi:dTDP-4-amino-4,6-dideoxygalactose transaminase